MKIFTSFFSFVTFILLTVMCVNPGVTVSGILHDSLPSTPSKQDNASEASSLVSEANKPSAGASWQRPAEGRPTAASLFNYIILTREFPNGLNQEPCMEAGMLHKNKS